MLTAIAYTPFAAADSCTINTKNIKSTLNCLNQRLDQLEGLDNNNEPVYQYDRIKITVKASRQTTTNPSLFEAKVSFNIKNVSGKNLLLGQNSINSVSISDNAGVNCRPMLDGWNVLFSDESNPDKFVRLKSGKSVVVAVDQESCMDDFKGSSFNISIDFLEYDYNNSKAMPFTAAMTGISAPIK